MARRMTLVRRTAALLCALGAALPAAAAAAPHPEYLVQLGSGVGAAAGAHAISDAGGHVTRDLHIIDAYGARLPDGALQQLRVTAFNQSLGTDRIWTSAYAATGRA